MRIRLIALAALLCASVCQATLDGGIVGPAEDWLSIQHDGDVWLDVGEAVNSDEGAYFYVESGSAATVTVSGLPLGVRFNAGTMSFSGAPTRRGVYYVTYSAKNKNRYSQSHVSVWTVGEATNGDYDNIGLENWFDFDEVFGELSAGDELNVCTNLKSITGLPAGLKFVSQNCDSSGMCTACSGFVRGTVSRAGKYKLTFSDYNRNKAVKTIVVEDPGCKYLNVVSPDPSRGTATGSRVYAIGSKAAISARPARGYYFAGWYRDEDFSLPLDGTASGDWRKTNNSVIVTSEIALSGIYARFVSSDEDDISIDCDDVWNVETWHSDWLEVGVSSATIPNVTVKGLPSGVTWNKQYSSLSTAPARLKPGAVVATITAKNQSGRVATKTIRIVVPNIESWVFSGLDYSDEAYSLTAAVGGYCVPEWISFEYYSDYKITISGLPLGLKFTAVDGEAAITGTPTKAGVYTVTLTAKMGRYTEKATFTINVTPLPDYTIGTYNGALRDPESDNIIGSFVFTAAANGRQSVKVVTEQGTVLLSAASWNCLNENGSPSAYLWKSSKTESAYLMLNFTGENEWNCDRQLEGSFSWSKSTASSYVDIEGEVAFAQRNPFAAASRSYGTQAAKDVADMLANDYKSTKMVIFWDYDLGAYRMECADCVLLPSGPDGTATLRVNKNGTVAIAGKLHGLYSFSSTANLVFDTACTASNSSLHGEHFYALFQPVLRMKLCPLSTSSARCITENKLTPIYWTPLE